MGKLENVVETYLQQEIKKIGGTTRKYVSPGHVGVADRLVFLPGGIVIFVEVKSDKGKESPKQARERMRMKALDFDARVIFGKVGVDNLILDIKSKYMRKRILNFL